MSKPKNTRSPSPQIPINFHEYLPLKPCKPKIKPKSNKEVLLEYTKRLFIEVKALRLEVQELKKLIKEK